MAAIPTPCPVKKPTGKNLYIYDTAQSSNSPKIYWKTSDCHVHDCMCMHMWQVQTHRDTHKQIHCRRHEVPECCKVWLQRSDILVCFLIKKCKKFSQTPFRMPAQANSHYIYVALCFILQKAVPGRMAEYSRVYKSSTSFSFFNSEWQCYWLVNNIQNWRSFILFWWLCWNQSPLDFLRSFAS